MTGQFAAMLLAMLAPAPAASAHDITPVPIDEVTAEYTRPQRLVTLSDGRRMNLYCRGIGPTTVLFDSGASGEAELDQIATSVHEHLFPTVRSARNRGSRLDNSVGKGLTSG